jgi:hypothetical protein
MSKMLKGLGSGGLGIASVLVFFVLPLALLFNAGVLAGWFEKLIVPACIICEWVIVIRLFVLLPLAIFRWTRGFAASGLMLASFAFGVTTWMASFSITYYYWGVVGVVIGLVFADRRYRLTNLCGLDNRWTTYPWSSTDIWITDVRCVALHDAGARASEEGTCHTAECRSGV